MKCTNCGDEIVAGSNFCVKCGTPVVPTGRVRIGRDANCDIVVNHERVSRLHAVIEREGGQYRITDQNSLNGVYVNGNKVLSALVNHGDRISLGRVAELDWNKIVSALSGAGSSDGGSSSYTPVFYPQESSERPKSPLLKIGLIALGVIVLLGAVYFLFLREGAPGLGKTYNIQAEHSYTTLAGEEAADSNRRSELEAMEFVLGKAKEHGEMDLIELEPVETYCLLDYQVGEPDESSAPDGESRLIKRKVSFKITKKELNARKERLNNNGSYRTRITKAAQDLKQKREILRIAGEALKAATTAPDPEGLVRDLFPELIPPARADQQPAESTLERRSPLQPKYWSNLALEGAREQYRQALTEMEKVYDSLNDIKAGLKSKDKGGRNLK